MFGKRPRCALFKKVVRVPWVTECIFFIPNTLSYGPANILHIGCSANGYNEGYVICHMKNEINIEYRVYINKTPCNKHFPVK